MAFGLPQELLHFIERDHARSITECLARSGMGLQKEAIATHSHRCPGEMGNILGTSSPRIFARDTVVSDDVCGVEDHRATGLLQDGNGAEVRDEFVISETSSSLGQKNLMIPGAVNFLDRPCHVLWSNELPLLNIDRSPRLSNFEKKTCLLTEKGWDLNDIENLLGLIHILHPVHI